METAKNISIYYCYLWISLYNIYLLNNSIHRPPSQQKDIIINLREKKN